MSRGNTGIRGRNRELDVLRTALAGRAGRLVVVRGPKGIGRTTLLDAATAKLLPNADQVLSVSVGAELSDSSDSYGVQPVLQTIRDRFERFGDRRLADSVNVLSRLSELVDGNPDWWLPKLTTELDVMFECLRKSKRTIAVLVVDDAHLVTEPALVLASARRSGCLVVVSCRDDVGVTPGLTELLTIADEEIVLGPLSDADVESLVSRALGARVDDAVAPAVRAALGPHYGVPGTVLATVRELRERDRLALIKDRLCLRDPAEPVPLPAEHQLLRGAQRLGELGPRLLAAVAALDEIGMDELPLLTAALGLDLRTSGPVLDRLIAAGILVADSADRVSCCCPALSAAALAAEGGSVRASVHARMAERLLECWSAGDSVDLGAMADHVAGSGGMLELAAPVVDLLLTRAAEIDADQPDRAARWYAAAARAVDPAEDTFAQALSKLLGLALRTGHYELLQEILVRRGIMRAGVATQADLRAAAALVGMHSATPMPASVVQELFADPATCNQVAAFAQWWFGRPGEAGRDDDRHPISLMGSPAVLSAGQLALLDAALKGDRAACDLAWLRLDRSMSTPDLDRLRAAASVAELATVFEIVLGEDYTLPATGLLPAYQRVVRGYADADWSAALSGVRELELTAVKDTLVHQAARLFAAEIDASRGHHQAAAEWIAASAPVPCLAALRAWVEVGLLHGTGKSARGVLVAQQTYRRLRDSGVRTGLTRLLLRALHIALSAGPEVVGPKTADELLNEIEGLHRRNPGAATLETVFLARGMVHGDLAYLRSGVDLARERGGTLVVFEACLDIAPLAEDPQRWLYEAYEIAGRCEAPALRERVRARIRELGVAAPRAKSRKEELSAVERRIIELIRGGLTNRQIALDIRISEKTVENHLTRLFARTGCRSRVELAAASLDGRLAAAVS